MFDLPLPLLLAMAAVALLAGIVKGVVGFGMPMIMVSGLASFLSAEMALAVLIGPTLASNIWQALRFGWRAVFDSMRKYRIFLGVMLVLLALSAQMVRVIPEQILFLFIGGSIVFFILIQLLGWQLRITETRRSFAQTALGAVSGIIGGISGVWGPPLVAYLTATNTPKQESMRIQGVVYGLGAIILTLAHIRSGVLTASTSQMSVLMVFPAIAGVTLGFWIHDRMPQEKFRKATMFVLILAGLNLIRRGLMG